MNAIIIPADRGLNGDDMANRSNPTFRVWTEPNRYGDGHLVFWVSPGLEPAMLKKPDGTPRIFANPDVGELAGWRRMAEALNKPRIMANKNQGRKEVYKRLTGPEFAAELRAAGITPTFLAYLYGTSQHRVLTWLDGAEDVPHPIRILLALFQDSERNIDIAEKVTDSVTTRRVYSEERKPKRKEG